MIVCAYVLAHDESSWVPADDPVATLRHETGHVLDYLLDSISEEQEYKHDYLLDIGVMEDGVRDKLAYYTQKGETGQRESFAEINCILLGGGNTEWRRTTEGLVAKNFPRSMQFVSHLHQTVTK